MGGGTNFLLNEKDPFAFGPGARPWTTLSPYLVERNGRFWMAAAVKGGDRQPYAFTQCLVNMVERGLDGGDAVARPRFRDASHAGKQVIEWDRPPYIASNQLPGGSNSTAYELAKKLRALGYLRRMHKPSRIEDSGFGVAQILVDNTAQELRDPQSILLATEILAISDLSRKPGLALVGSQATLVKSVELPAGAATTVDARDFKVIARPLRHFLSEHLRELSQPEMSAIVQNGYLKVDKFRESTSISIAAANVGMMELFHTPIRHDLKRKTNVNLVRIKSEDAWDEGRYRAFFPSTDRKDVTCPHGNNRDR